jgi:hypothetical protein
MFASAWQDGVYHLNPKYLRRDTLFTDKVMQLITAHDKALRDRLLAASPKPNLLGESTEYTPSELRGYNQGIKDCTAAIASVLNDKEG